MILKDLSWQAVDSISSIVFGILINLTIINYLNVEEFGEVSLVLSYYGILSMLLTMGLNQIILQSLLRREEVQFVEVAIKVRLILATTLLFILGGFAQVYSNKSLYFLSVISVSLLLESFYSFKESLFNKRMFKELAIAKVASGFVHLIFISVLARLNLGISWIMFSYVLWRLVFILFLAYYLKFNIKGIQTVFLASVDFQVILRGLPLLLAGFIGIVYTSFDQWIIAYLSDLVQVGIYSSGTKFVIMSMIVPTLVTNVYYQKLVDIFDDDSYNERVVLMYRMMLLMGIIMCITFFVSAPLITRYLLGQKYEEATPVIRIISLLLPLSFFQSLNNKLLILMNLENLLLFRSLIGIAFNVILSIVFFKFIGIIGVALATVVSEILILYSYRFNNRTKSIYLAQISALRPSNYLRSNTYRLIWNNFLK